jgi:hypothetical protein
VALSRLKENIVMPESNGQQAINWVGRLHRWGYVLVSRIMGTQLDTHQPTKGIRDLITKCLMLRAEANAMVGLLVEKGLITEAEFAARLQSEAEFLCKQYEEQFPGAKATDVGITIYDPKKYAETVKGWPA